MHILYTPTYTHICTSAHIYIFMGDFKGGPGDRPF